MTLCKKPSAPGACGATWRPCGPEPRTPGEASGMMGPRLRGFGFRVQGFRGLGFRGLRGLGFRGLGFRG